MLTPEWKNVRVWALAGVVAVGATASLVPAGPALAQSAATMRSLPDFTDLVEQVGPSVVNIRTVEKSTPRTGPTMRSR